MVLDGVCVPAENLLDEEGEGFYHVLGTLNTKRFNWSVIPPASGDLPLDLALDYAAERESFGRLIGKN